MPDPYLESTKCREKFRRAAKRSQPAACSTCARSSFCGRRPSWDLWIAVLVGKAMIPFDGSVQARGRAASAWRKPQDGALRVARAERAARVPDDCAHRLPEGGARRPSTGSLCSVGPAPGRRGTSRGAQSADCRSALYGRLRTERAVGRGPPHPLRIPLVGVRRAAA